LNANLNDLSVSGNYLETIIWMILALAFAIKAQKRPQGQKRLFLTAAVLFVVFGASDVVEAQTGAWWRPPWLLVWKGGCLVGFVLCWWKHRQMIQRDGPGDPNP